MNTHNTDPIKTRGRVSGWFAVALGAFLFIEGVWGLFTPVVFGALTTNITHAAIHVVLGGTGIGLGLRGPARGYCLFMGLLLPAVGLLRFIPATAPYVIEILNVNVAAARLNIILGGVALLVFFLSGRTERMYRTPNE
jgi:uncharacterized membrane protein